MRRVGICYVTVGICHRSIYAFWVFVTVSITTQTEGIATIGRICTTLVRKSLVTEMHARMPDVVLKLRRISAEQRKDIPLSSEKMTSTEKVSSFFRQAPRRLVAFFPWQGSRVVYLIQSTPPQASRVMYLVQSTSPPYSLIPHDFGGSLPTIKTVIYLA